MDLVLVSVFVAGLLGGTHCAGMCGGIVSALSLSGPQEQRSTFGRLLAYNLGRVGSYTAAGVLAGGTGAGSPI